MDQSVIIQQVLDQALAHHRAGRTAEAEQSYRQLVALRPGFAEAWNNLGNIIHEQGRFADALAAYDKATEIAPRLPEAHNNRSSALRRLGRLDDAVASSRRALELRENYPDAWSNLGSALREKGECHEAMAAYDRALALAPNHFQALNNRGILLGEMNRLGEAIESFRKAATLYPNYPETWTNWGDHLRRAGLIDEAILTSRRALAMRPNLAAALNNLASAYKDRGDLDQALACYDQLSAVRPDDAAADSNRLFLLQYHPKFDAMAILAAAREWERRHALALQWNIPSHANDRTANRRLRIGYVSPDFRGHCQAMFMWPLLSHHDPKEVEVFCYSDALAPDEVTAELRTHAHHWRNIVGVLDQDVADMIRRDGIDILVDLTMHMARNRLLVFARKPAPIQVTWLGYPGTTGLGTIDYRLTDPNLDPSGDEFYVEKSIRLPETFWCFDPGSPLEVSPPPALRNGYVTFGCLNNYCKVNDGVLDLWERVLNAVPGSRLILLTPQGSHRERLLARFGDRIELISRMTRSEYLAVYGRIDIGLDTFPYNGHTTSLDSFWMGVPVVTLIGKTVVGRAGLSQLRNLGLGELAADSPEQFVEIATSLAADPGKLRASLRERMRQSPLMDASRFARHVEAAYRRMWKEWIGRDEKQDMAHATSDAMDALARARDGENLNEMSVALYAAGRYDEAIAASLRATEIQPDSAQFLSNLGTYLKEFGGIDEAVGAFRRALALQGDLAEVYSNLAVTLQEQGLADEAMECLKRARAIKPDDAAIESNLIYAMQFHPAYDAEAIKAALAEFNSRCQMAIAPHENDRSAIRRLKIGYVSSDLRRHVVGWNILPMLEQHDHERFEIFGYSDVARPDEMTERIGGRTDQWRPIAGMSHDQAAALIRRDRIDILIDLSVHLGGNRMLMFARKPAPIQATYLGYCGSTGLEAVDYRFSDRYLDPPGTDHLYVEKTIRLPASYWCYRPGGDAPDITPLPDGITFTCMNNFSKVSRGALELWKQILAAVPGSRILIHSQPGSHLEPVKRLFGDTVSFVARQAWEGYIGTFQRASISLDPFPYGGGITSCDSLWMGVPVVTLSGGTPVGRAGRTILSQIGLDELVARTPEEYVKIAVTLAGDRARLGELRRTLRNRMRSSPLMDAKRLARDVEAAYTRMWQTWISR